MKQDAMILRLQNIKEREREREREINKKCYKSDVEK